MNILLYLQYFIIQEHFQAVQLPDVSPTKFSHKLEFSNKSRKISLLIFYYKKTIPMFSILLLTHNPNGSYSILNHPDPMKVLHIIASQWMILLKDETGERESNITFALVGYQTTEKHYLTTYIYYSINEVTQRITHPRTNFIFCGLTSVS